MKKTDIDATALMGDGRGPGGNDDGGGAPGSLWCNWSDDPEILKILLAQFDRSQQQQAAEGAGAAGAGAGDAQAVDGARDEGETERGEGGQGGDGVGAESADVHLHLSEVCMYVCGGVRVSLL